MLCDRRRKPGADSSMSEPVITREETPTKGRYVARVEGIDAEAEMTYSRSSPTLIIADHTEVPDAFRGKGMGRLLATRMVEDARKEGVKIFVLCPFVNAERKKHPDWADVFQN
jgi:uncharacterized protein